MDSEGDWSVVPARDRQKGVRDVSSVAKSTSTGAMNSNKSDESLIGSFLYRGSRAKPPQSDSDLIGAPVILRAPQEPPNQLKAEDVVEGVGRGRGLLRLTPGMMRDIETQRLPQAEFSLDSPSDWPAFPDTQPLTSDNQTSDNKSWSTVLKAPAPPKKTSTVNEEVKGQASADSGSEEEEPKKKKKKKKLTEGLLVNKQPLMLELGALFDGLKVKSSGNKKVVLSTGGGLAVSKATPITQHSRVNNTKEVARGGNILDSTAPLVKRGKEREQPKKHKPTPLRKIINKEKEERKMERINSAEVTNNDTKEHLEAVNDNTEDTSNDISDYKEVANNDKELNTMEEIKEEINDEEKEVVKIKMDDKTVQLNNAQETKAARPRPPTIPGHNRRFREYCNHLVTEEINSTAQMLLSELLRFQDRQFLKDPIKARSKKRYVCGMREVLKHLQSRRVQCLIVAPNMERSSSEGGIDDVIGRILSLAAEQELPIVFALSRRRLAVTLKKPHKVACVGVFRHEGAETHYKKLLELVEEAREQYQRRAADLLAIEHISHPLHTPEKECVKCEDGDLKNGPWSVFFAHPPSTVLSTDYSTVQDHVTSDSDHVTCGDVHETTQFNVFAKEFVPLFNVHAPEFHPS